MVGASYLWFLQVMYSPPVVLNSYSILKMEYPISYNTKVRIICETTKFILHFVIPLPCCIFVSMYNDLLEMRDILSDIASELYGELYVCNDDFWGSPTEREMYKVEESLSNLGFKYIPSPDMMSIVDMMAQEKGMKRRD